MLLQYNCPYTMHPSHQHLIKLTTDWTDNRIYSQLTNKAYHRYMSLKHFSIQRTHHQCLQHGWPLEHDSLGDLLVELRLWIYQCAGGVLEEGVWAQSHFTGLATCRLTCQLPVVQEQRLLGKEDCSAPHQHHPGAWADRWREKEIKFNITLLLSFDYIYNTGSRVQEYFKGTT